ncbi:MAG: ABC transporter permease [Caldisericia bacterium]|nr:ABC transporter permease [Caldisericia bacterium]
MNNVSEKNSDKNKIIATESRMMLARGFIFDNFSWVLLLLIFIIAGIINPVFYSLANITNLLLHSVILGILVLAETICLITGHFDLTIESTLVFTAVCAAWLISPSSIASGWQLNSTFAVIIMLIIGAVIGAVNGSLVAYVRMNPFITTLAMSIILLGFSVIISKGRTIYPLPATFIYLGSGLIRKFPIAIIFLIFLFVLFYIILTLTPIGRKLYAVGSNRFAADASGINTKFIIFLSYTLSGLLCACAGWVMAGKLNSASPNMSSNQMLYACAAAVIGGVSLNGGVGNIFGVFGGVLLLSSINTLMNLIRINPFIIQSTTGGIILFAMFINTIKSGKNFRY